MRFYRVEFAEHLFVIPITWLTRAYEWLQWMADFELIARRYCIVGLVDKGCQDEWRLPGLLQETGRQEERSVAAYLHALLYLMYKASALLENKRWLV